MIIYREFDISEMVDVVAVYEDIGWIMYLQDKDKLFEKVMDKFKTVRTFMVVTDTENKKNQAFIKNLA